MVKRLIDNAFEGIYDYVPNTTISRRRMIMNKHAFSNNDLLAMHWTGNPVLSNNGSKLLYEVTDVNADENKYVTNIWLWDGEKSSEFTTGSGQALTNNRNPLWSPNDQAVAFLSNRSGKNQIWLTQFGTGEARQLTHAPAGVDSFAWSPDSKTIYYLATEYEKENPFPKQAKVTHITKLRYKFNGTGYLSHIPKQLYSIRICDLANEQLTSDELGAGAPVVSPCGKYIAFSANRTTDEQDLKFDIWLLEIATRILTCVTPHTGRFSEPLFLPDGRLLCKGNDVHPYPGGYPQIWEIDRKTHTVRNLTAEYPHYIGKSVGNDVSSERGKNGVTVSADSRTLYFIATIGGNCYLESLDLTTGQFARVFGEGQMVITSYDLKGDCIALNLADPTTPCDIWVGNQEEIERITYLNVELFADKYIGWPEPIHFASPEGVTLEGWLIKPINYVDGAKHKTIMEIHGGPHSTYGNIFFHEFQILAGNGYAVFYANPRGSLGYGEAFSRAVVGDWCGCDARDLQFMADQVRQLDWVDEMHFGVTGGSQGGYFTNWLIGHCDYFSAAVTQRSMSNLYTKYGIADNGWNGDRFGMGGADLWDQEDFILERSPIRYAPNVHTPLLFIHSDQDLRCPLEQAEQFYVALKRLGNITEMMIFHGENHNLSRTGSPANRLVRLDAILNWFNKYC